jgi:L-ribulose-5-phosphate 4-epimerase
VSILPRDEGYVKFSQQRQPGPPLHPRLWQELEAARAVLYAAGLVGMYPDGIGFGNVSWIPKTEASPGLPFVVSGTQTGHKPALDGSDYVLVRRADIAANTVYCSGPVDASSESLTHAAVYAAQPEARCVLHVHHAGHWERLLHRAPTTSPHVPYGTPEMAFEVARLFDQEDLARAGLFAMAGHEEGLVAFGSSTAEALENLRRWGVLT